MIARFIRRTSHFHMRCPQDPRSRRQYIRLALAVPVLLLDCVQRDRFRIGLLDVAMARVSAAGPGMGE